jgi:hypothetical protein
MITNYQFITGRKYMDTTDTTLKQETEIALMTAQNMMVKCDADYIAAGNARKELNNAIKKISDYWDPKVNQAYQMHKTLVASKKDMTTPLEQADRLIDQRMGEYRREQERIRMEAERERQRREAEARRAAEEAQRLLEEASQQEELDDDSAEILQMAQNDIVMAEMAVDSIVVAPVVKMQGINVRKVWKAKVVNDTLVPVMVGRLLLRPINMSTLNDLAKTGIDVPGVEFYQEEISVVKL